MDLERIFSSVDSDLKNEAPGPAVMPGCCFSEHKIGHLWKTYLDLLAKKFTEEEALLGIGIDVCLSCRTSFLTNKNLFYEQLAMNKTPTERRANKLPELPKVT
jgi:DNA-directed RNA polymerase subunit N (RpoN/RPB10)